MQVQLKDIMKFDFFKAFTADEVNQLVKCGSLVEADEGAPLIVAQSEANELFFILTGTCQVRVVMDEKSIPIALLRPGEFAGEGALFADSMRSASVLVRTKMVGIHWKKSELDKLFLSVPVFGVKFFRSMAFMSWSRLNESNAKLREAFRGIVEF